MSIMRATIAPLRRAAMITTQQRNCAVSATHPVFSPTKYPGGMVKATREYVRNGRWVSSAPEKLMDNEVKVSGMQFPAEAQTTISINDAADKPVQQRQYVRQGKYVDADPVMVSGD